MTTKRQIRKKDEAAVPAYLMVDESDLGSDNIGSSEIVIPRIKICQAMSDIKSDNDQIKDGDIYTNLGEVIGNNIKFFVLTFWKSKVWFSPDKKLLCTEFNDPETREPIKFGNDVSVSEFGEEKLAKQEITVIDSYNYMVIPEKLVSQALKKGEIPFPYIYAGGSAAIKYCRQLNGKIKTNALKKIPIYGQLITMDTKLDKFSKGSAYMPRFSYTRYADENEFKFLKELYKSCKQLIRRSEVHEYDDEKIEQEVSKPPTAQKSNNKDASDETSKLFED